MTLLLFTALGALVGLGCFLLLQGALGRPVLPRPQPRTRPGPTIGVMLAWLTVGLAVGILVFLVTGWPVAAVAVAGMVAMLPRLFGTRRHQTVFIERTQAIASWTEMIRDNLAGAAGLEQALLASAPMAPEPIRTEIKRLEARLDRQVPLVEALRALSEELDHPSADLVVIAIAKASFMEVRDLNPLLTRLSASIRDDVRMRLRIEVSRTRIRQSARIVIGFTVGFMVLIYALARELLRPYDEPLGQVWLCLVVGVFVTAGWLIGRYSRLELPTRFVMRRRMIHPMEANT